MSEKEFNLSEKIYDLFAKGEFPYIKLNAKQRQEIMYKVLSLNKEFIRRLKEICDETDDEHLIHFRNKKSQDYIGGWLDACERIKKRINKLAGEDLHE